MWGGRINAFARLGHPGYSWPLLLLASVPADFLPQYGEAFTHGVYHPHRHWIGGREEEIIGELAQRLVKGWIRTNDPRLLTWCSATELLRIMVAM